MAAFDRACARFALGLAIAAAASPSTSHAQVVFGANLARPVNYGFDCTVAPGTGAFGDRVLYPTNVGTCTWSATGVHTASGQQEAFLVPNGLGTITSVRVKVGQITGPMQVVVLRAIRGVDPNQPPAGAACCAEVGRSAVFTPAPNAISTIAMNLPVKADIVPNPLTNAYDFDTLGLSVLAPGVPIPIHDTGAYADLSAPSAGVFFPAINPGQERADIFGTFGYQVLMEATWVPGQGGGGGGGGVVVVAGVAGAAGAAASSRSSSRSPPSSGSSCRSDSAATRPRPVSARSSSRTGGRAPTPSRWPRR